MNKLKRIELKPAEGELQITFYIEKDNGTTLRADFKNINGIIGFSKILAKEINEALPEELKSPKICLVEDNK